VPKRWPNYETNSQGGGKRQSGVGRNSGMRGPGWVSEMRTGESEARCDRTYGGTGLGRTARRISECHIRGKPPSKCGFASGAVSCRVLYAVSSSCHPSLRQLAEGQINKLSTVWYTTRSKKFNGGKTLDLQQPQALTHLPCLTCGILQWVL
jgi:hypothetical protein